LKHVPTRFIIPWGLVASPTPASAALQSHALPVFGRGGEERMDRHEVEEVLANWISQATSSPGRLAPGTDPAKWVAAQFLRWWQSQIADELNGADTAVAAARQELDRLGGWSNPQFGEALHELVHAHDALADLRSALGLDTEEE
jgi:hypothetical protein